MFRAMGLIGLLSLVSRLGTEHEEPLIRWALFSVSGFLRVWLQLEKDGVGQRHVFVRRSSVIFRGVTRALGVPELNIARV